LKHAFFWGFNAITAGIHSENPIFGLYLVKIQFLSLGHKPVFGYITLYQIQSPSLGGYPVISLAPRHDINLISNSSLLSTIKCLKSQNSTCAHESSSLSSKSGEKEKNCAVNL